MPELKELKFTAHEEKGEVSALYLRPRGAGALLVLGHGAGTSMRHPFMEELAQALAAAGVATFRYNYPYSEKGRGGMDGEKVRLSTVRAAVAAAARQARGLPLFAGGHSMSGRMTSMAAAEEPLGRPAGDPLLRLPPAPGGQAGDRTRRPPRKGDGADAVPLRPPRRPCRALPAGAGGEEAREAGHPPPRRHRRPRLPCEEAQPLLDRAGDGGAGAGVPPRG